VLPPGVTKVPSGASGAATGPGRFGHVLVLDADPDPDEPDTAPADDPDADVDATGRAEVPVGDDPAVPTTL